MLTSIEGARINGLEGANVVLELTLSAALQGGVIDAVEPV